MLELFVFQVLRFLPSPRWVGCRQNVASVGDCGSWMQGPVVAHFLLFTLSESSEEISSISCSFDTESLQGDHLCVSKETIPLEKSSLKMKTWQSLRMSI